MGFVLFDLVMENVKVVAYEKILYVELVIVISLGN